MRIYYYLCFLLLIANYSSAGPVEECQILQTTDVNTPCYVSVRNSNGPVPSFLYVLNLPRPTPEVPCPLSQTLDPTLNCHVQLGSPHDPAFILNVPLPPNADEIDESPFGKAKLRLNKENPIFRKTDRTVFAQSTLRKESMGSFGPPSPLLTKALFKPLSPLTDLAGNAFSNRLPLNDPSHSVRVVVSRPGFHFVHYETRHGATTHVHHPLGLSHSLSSSQFGYSSSEGGATSSAFHRLYPPTH